MNQKIILTAKNRIAAQEIIARYRKGRRTRHLQRLGIMILTILNLINFFFDFSSEVFLNRISRYSFINQYGIINTIISMRENVVTNNRGRNEYVGGVTEVPNMVFRNPDLSLGARITFTLCLRYQKVYVPNIRKHLSLDVGADAQEISSYLNELVRVGYITIADEPDDEMISINF